MRADDLQKLKQAYAEGMASGEGREVSAETLLADVKRKAVAQAERADLRASIQQGLSSGPSLPLDMAEIQATARTIRAAKRK